MQKKFFLLLSAISFISTVQAADGLLESAEVAKILTVIKRENRTINPDAGFCERSAASCERLLRTPSTFCSMGTSCFFISNEKILSGEGALSEEKLLDDIMQQELTMNNINIFKALPGRQAFQVLKAFKHDQKQAIKSYACKMNALEGPTACHRVGGGSACVLGSLCAACPAPAGCAAGCSLMTLLGSWLCLTATQ